MNGTLGRNAAAYMLGGKRLDSLDMDALMRWEKYFQMRIARAARGGYSDVATFREPV
ncbi:unnamed protein product [marine sediment metagenome]|uniref:Uncharacterized protein n=1 Tax=marine sediment metagenome TaxID=412755 RepID=X1EQF9_9ZZZZ